MFLPTVFLVIFLRSYVLVKDNLFKVSKEDSRY